MLQLRNALIISRLRYHLPYTNLRLQDINWLDALIQKATKLAIGIPFSASTKLLLDMGSHNTVAELASIHRRRQELRLQRTSQGRHILHSIGHHPQASPTVDTRPIPPKQRELLTIALLPRHMNPKRDKER